MFDKTNTCMISQNVSNPISIFSNKNIFLIILNSKIKIILKKK